MNKLLTFGIWILLVLASVNAYTFSNPSFETTIGTEWGYSESNANWVSDGQSTTSHFGLYSYKMHWAEGTPSGSSYAKIFQNNTNLVGVSNITVWARTGLSSGEDTLEVLINDTSLGYQIINGSFVKYTFNITPSSLKTAGQNLVLKVNSSDANDVDYYLDDINVNTFLGACTGSGQALNLSFKNSTGNNVINGSIVNLALSFSGNGESGNTSFTGTNAKSYGFCSYPTGTTLTTTGTITYSLTGFEQRSIYLSESLIDTSTLYKVLYLLESADGLYTTFQVLDEGNSPISNVAVIGEELISGTYTEVVGGTTDSAGSVTFWVNPDNVHRFTFTKSGYTTAVYTVTPTQSAYTVNMGGATQTNETNYNLGILYNILPTDTTLNSSTNYNFIFNISSSLFSLTDFGFILRNSTGGAITTVTNTTGTAGGLINYTYNTTTDSRVFMNYFWTANGTTLTNTREWYIKDTYIGNFSVVNLINDLKGFNHNGFDDFGRAIVFIFVLIIIVGLVVGSVESRVEIEYAVLGIITTLVWIGEYSEWIQPIGQKYFITTICALILVAYAIQDNVK